jgi:hypothetical protein
MKRSVLIVLMALVALVVAPQADAVSATTSRVFNHFQGRVCRLEHRMMDKAGPTILRFNDLYYGEAEAPENPQAAGQELRHLYSIYQSYNQRILKTRAPANNARLWKRYGRQQRQVQRLGFQGATALEAADLPSFKRIKARNEHWQVKRNTTWAQIGIVCP